MPGKSQGSLQRSLNLPIEKGLVGWLNFNAELFLKSIGGDGGVERGRLYLTVTVTTIMTLALRWAAMGAILLCL